MHKYRTNHSAYFRYGKVAMLVSFMQFSVVLFNEIINVAVICSSETYLDVIKDYVALGALAELDDFFL